MTPDSVRAAPRRWRKLLPFVGLLVLAWVLTRLDLRALGRAVSRIPPSSLVLACLAFAINLWIKVWRWQRLLLAQSIELPHRVALAAFMSGQFYAQISVGRVGEFLRIEALTERGVRAGTALSSCVFDRLLDVCLVLCAGCVLGALVVGHAAAAVAAAFALGILLSLGALFVRAMAGPAARSWLPGWLRARPFALRVVEGLHLLAQGMLPMLRTRCLLEASCWTLLAWTFYFGALWAIAGGLHIAVPMVVLIATASFAALSALLPVTISGLGARELIYLEVLKSHSVPGESAVALSLLHLGVMTLVASGLGIVGVWWRQRQRL
jgi:uncharacterized protein (TIRG00374 family)